LSHTYNDHMYKASFDDTTEFYIKNNVCIWLSIVIFFSFESVKLSIQIKIIGFLRKLSGLFLHKCHSA
jgi:hypothetical protein